MEKTDKKVQAFWKFLLEESDVKKEEFDEWFEDLYDEACGDNTIKDNFSTGHTYLILTDEEANAEHFERCKEIVDDCYMPEVNKILHDKENRNWAFADCFSFDYEKYSEIVATHDGRGNTLSSYDGEEHEIMVDGEWFYLYRIA